MLGRKLTVHHSVFPTHNGVLSHVFAFLVMVAFVLTTSSGKTNSDFSITTKNIVHFIHLFSFSTWVGIQCWVHVSGFTLYKTLKRTDFVAVQSKLFPMYFKAGFFLSSIALLTHIVSTDLSWQNDRVTFYQTLGLMVSLACCLLNLCYLGPRTIQIVQERAARVKALGIKDGVGRVCLNLVKNDTEYMRIRKSFLFLHMWCSLVNLFCYGACGVNIWCLTTKHALL
ncbi:transmembrane protein 205-like [Xenia sp. Carnegie-2017]|uniref:transmembrane protein 205-like n=1 Tax=Xenia sp. Carnegie-2017 TaxID=2897299 RepID=UPI001F03571E|nr:transmembrane protein 205-like [Xenia sp. Carnegie-2017]